jgi:membrane dipeptidase
MTLPVFDGHNDVLLRLALLEGVDPVQSFMLGTHKGHIDLPKAEAGGLAGGLFAIFCPSPMKGGAPSSVTGFSTAELGLDEARVHTGRQISIFTRLADAGAIAACRNVAEIEAAMAAGKLAAVLHLEGVEAIDSDLEFLDLLYAAGLRSLGPVWSRPNIFGHGVPFGFPGSPDNGPGLTEAGKRLVAACNRKGILIDLSHLNEKGFWDVAALSSAPLVATHSNVHALCPTPRNLTAKQLAAIRDSDGMVGLNFATGFLRADGKMNPDTDLDDMVRHLDALIDALGETRVGLGSDFDGATVPNAIGDAAGLPVLFQHLGQRGYGEPLLQRLASGNWLDLLRRTIG